MIFECIEERDYHEWQPRLTIGLYGDEIHAMVCRMFKCFSFEGIEAKQTTLLCGFKRTYCISVVPKPVRIIPPTWFVRDWDSDVTIEHICQIEGELEV